MHSGLVVDVDHWFIFIPEEHVVLKHNHREAAVYKLLLYSYDISKLFHFEYG